MSWNIVRMHYGLSAPYDFRVAVPFLLGCLGAAASMLTAVAYFSIDELGFGSQRFWFLACVGLAFLVASLASRRSALSWLCIALASLELGLGIGSDLLARAGLGRSLMPPDVHLGKEVRFMYHPLLQIVPVPNFTSSKGRLVRHNSLGLRGAEPTPLQQGRTTLINVYGGSTTYDTRVPNGKTWPEQLERELGDGYLVLNFGVPGYSTVEHVIQTAFYSNKLGRSPACAVYYVGWNDIRSAHLPDLDNAYANYHLPDQRRNFLQRQGSEFSPLLSVLIPYLKSVVDTVPPPPRYALTPKSGTDPRLEAIFLANISSIVALNKGRGTKSIFIGQILNREKLKSDRVYGWLPLVRDKDVWPLQAHFNSLLQALALSIDAVYIDADVDSFSDADFADNGHFSEGGSLKFAKSIAGRIAQSCR
ncbi:MAG: hypothetical protein HY067_16645 [Betaproteobacteria bacterium]|nr:hypothetical protein [Betaproteobacteria bacterium]